MTNRRNAKTFGTVSTPHGSDGALERVLRMGQKPKAVPAIFIHAGAGFHSHQNEHVHLEACVAAAEMGMKFLKAGATATQAVEASLRILEDREITNAGYGSNLSINGSVECDATVVDHLGRSGACGAVPNIRNPISLAKLILDKSNKPLSLRRVPPNTLVGDGAKDFAKEHGIATFSNEYLVSKNARDRFLRWQDDLKRADAKPASVVSANLANVNCTPCQYDTASPQDHPRAPQREHSAAIMAGTWNEGQPDSPYIGSPDSLAGTSDTTASGYFRGLATTSQADRPGARKSSDRLASSGTAVSSGKAATSPPARSRGHGKKGGEPAVLKDGQNDRPKSEEGSGARQDGASSPRHNSSPHLPEPSLSTVEGSHCNMKDFQGDKRPLEATDDKADLSQQPQKRLHLSDRGQNDLITDTIGAIAIDEKGHIAAASSSGGIGMKHKGRIGPAALVGIGTAVIPCAEDDEEGLTVAAVTSGTGEHMATTMAAQKCAERIYRGTRRGSGGMDVQDDDEDAIMESFIVDDFMDHPGVKNCYSAGAIGVMVVKKTRTGYYLYFAHNTDSFALASMGSGEKEPLCTMSRLSEGAKIARGGRKIRMD